MAWQFPRAGTVHPQHYGQTAVSATILSQGGGGTRPRREFAAAFLAGTLTADELLSRYCTLVYSQTHGYERAAKHLKLDRRTVKSNVNSELLARLFTN